MGLIHLKIALSSAGYSEYSLISSSLGKCPTFIVYDHDTKTFECLENHARKEDKSNGPKAIRYLKEEGIDALITWHIGDNAYNQSILSGLPIYLCNQGEIIRDVIYKYFNNEIPLLENAETIKCN